MVTLYVYFAGLICHFGPSDNEGSNRLAKITAKLIDDPDHTAYISFANVDTQLFRLRFRNSNGPATSDHNFQDMVPHLDDLTRSGIKLKRNARGIDIKLPDGEFAVADTYHCGARYSLDNQYWDKPCVARLVVIPVTDEESIVVDYNDTSVTFTEDSWMCIVNAANMRLEEDLNHNCGSSTSMQHFEKHSKVTTGTTADIATWSELNRGCTTTVPAPPFHDVVAKHLHDQHPFTATHSECSNTNWP